MEDWFRNRNKRRFFRKVMPAKVLLKPHYVSTTKIVSNGVNYTPEFVEAQFELLLSTIKREGHKVQEHKEVLVAIANQFTEAFRYFFTLLKAITEGAEIRDDLVLWGRRAEFLNGVDLSEMVKEEKTYKMLSLLNEKYTISLQQLVEVIEHSNQHFIHSVHWQNQFDLEETKAQLEDDKFARIPLAQLIISLIHAIDYVVDIFHDFLADYQKGSNPRYWRDYSVNISAGGLSLRMKKQYNKFDSLDVFLQISGHLFKFDGKIVDLFDCRDGMETVAIDFEFPDGGAQNRLVSLIQLSELDECFALEG